MDITLKRIDKMTDQELDNAIDACFDEAPERDTDLGRVTILLEAQFYRTEKYSRVDEKAQIARDKVETDRWRIDLKNEKIIIVMIAIEIVLSFVAIDLAIYSDRRQSQDVQQQLEAFGRLQTILFHLETSSQATVDTMKALKGTTEEMSASLQKQLALFYEVSVNVIYNPATKQLAVSNNGRTNVTLWGDKSADQAASIISLGRTITPTGAITVDAKDMYDIVVARFPKPMMGTLPYELYIKNEKGKEFIQINSIGIHWENDQAIIFVQTDGIAPGKWKQPAVHLVP
jgi:hypothetical protein